MSKLFENYEVEPVGDFVLVRRENLTERIGSAGLVVPQSSIEKSQLAEVLAVGPGRVNDRGDRIPLQVKTGDTVILDTIAGIPMKVEEEDIVVCREAEIVAIVRTK